MFENIDFNYIDEIVGTRIYNEEIGHIKIESFLVKGKNRLIEVRWQDEFKIS